VAATTGLLGAAGAATAGIQAGGSDPAPAAANAHTTPVADDSGPDPLLGYVDDMSGRAGRLQDRVAEARARLRHAKAERAALIAAAQAQAAQALAAQQTASDDRGDDGYTSPEARHDQAPAVHTSTGASSSDDEAEHEDEHEDEHHEAEHDDGHDD
jgi:hypothetical protein